MTQEEAFKKFDEINAIDLYVNKDKSGAEISEIAGIKNHQSIFTYLKLKGIPRKRAARRKSIREIPPVGKKFGLWTVISDEVKSGQFRNLNWLCQCECGHIQWKASNALKLGKTHACKKCAALLVAYGDTSANINSVINSKFNQIKSNRNVRSKVSKLPFTITESDLQDLYNKSHFCALSGIDLSVKPFQPLSKQNLSIDRIDSNRGYEPDNIQLVDKRINMMKQSFTNEEFIELCCKVAEQHGYTKCS